MFISLILLFLKVEQASERMKQWGAGYEKLEKTVT